jgi:uncharacterized paraquat-inducible protein A
VREREDMLLGTLAVRHGICTVEQVDECLRMQSMAGSDAPLGDLLLFKGYLTAPQLRDLLARQHKKVMACLACRLSFTVVTLSQGKTVRCPRCKGPLQDGGGDHLLKTDAEFSTRRVPAVAPPAGPQEDVACVVCDHRFRAARDASGRVRCPSCQSSFSTR